MPHLPLRLPDDDLVPLLRKVSSEDLGILVELIHRDRNEELSTVPEFLALNPRAAKNIHDGDHRVYADDIAAEIQRYCGNTISNLFRGGQGVPYIEVVHDVADKLKVNYNKNAAADRVEREILLKVLERAYEKMSDKEKTAILKELGVPSAAGSLPSSLPVMAVQGAINISGFAAYKLTVIVANAIVNALVAPVIGRGPSLAANAALTRAVGAFAGPIGWVVTAGWTLYELGGPAYRILVPCVAHIAYLRQAYCTCQQCWEVQPAAADYCQNCGTRIGSGEDGSTSLDGAPSSDSVNALIASGASVEARDEDDSTPLHAAAREGLAESVEALVAAGADIGARDEEGSTPLDNALAAGSARTVEALIAAGADVNAGGESGFTPLHMAAAVCKPKIVKALLDAGADIEAQDENGNTPLRTAAISDNLKIVQTLIDAGADVETQDENGNTLLHMAVLLEWPKLVKVLVDAGADIETGIDGGPSLLNVAASTNEEPKIVRALMGAGADIETRDDHGQTPLRSAILGGKSKTVRALLDAGADIESQDEYGNTPLIEAVTDDKPEIAQALLDAGADIEAKDAGGGTPLHNAAVFAKPKMVRVLLAAGAEITARDEYGNTPLHVAVIHERAKNVQALLEAGADTEARDEAGCTPLDVAGGKPKMEQVLRRSAAK